ncbi:MAG: Spy/CpxP family protein refolding chaperone [Pirellulales bacterium]|nr:Spy/CpxP family protein refolding chaperone [Pirellulales bacterium]
MHRRTLIVLVLTGALAATAAAAPGAAKRHGHRLAETPLGRLISGNIGRMLVLRSELNLTDEQRSKIREVLVSHKQEIAKRAKAVWEKRNALREEVLASGTDEPKIRSLAGELTQAVADAAVLASKLRDEIAPVLSDEQRELVKKHLAECDGAVAKFFEKAVQE